MFGAISGKRSKWRRHVTKQFGSKQLKGLAIVHVIPQRQNNDFDVGGLCSCNRLRKNRRGAPCDIGENFGMSTLQSDQIVATVLRWPKDNAIAFLLQLGDRLLKCSSRNGGRIGIDEANASIAARQKVLRSRKKTLTKAIATLWNQSKIIGQKVVEKTFIADRGVTDNAGCTARCSNCDNIR